MPTVEFDQPKQNCGKVRLNATLPPQRGAAAGSAAPSRKRRSRAKQVSEANAQQGTAKQVPPSKPPEGGA